VILSAHLAFVLFVIFGGLPALRWRRIAWFHLPAAMWGAWIELSGGICPLTPLENRLRRLGGEAGYGGGFVEHYLAPTLYPDGLTRPTQVALGVAVVLLNAAIYLVMALRSRRALEDR